MYYKNIISKKENYVHFNQTHAYLIYMVIPAAKFKR